MYFRIVLPFLICFAFSIAEENAVEDSDVIVNTQNGQVRGRVVKLSDQKINFFNSIRFGKAPVGDLRFRRPEPADSWSGVYEATKNRPVCYQSFIPNIAPKIVNMSEDCLFVNVWSKNVSPDAKQPVMVWFTGGSYVFGGATEIFTRIYDGRPLALQDVVVVTVNYRMGNLGFLYDGTDEAPGNAGLFDQLLAMKWVQQNIVNFGGDPSQVTIFGESAGSWSVGVHLISPLSKGLFKRAIMQSGSPYFFLGKNIDNKNSLKSSKKLASQRLCLGNNWIKCLKKVHPQLVVLPKIDLTEMPLPPLVTNELIPEGTMEAVRQGKVNPTAEVLTGLTTDEGSIFSYFIMQPQTYDPVLRPAIILSRIEAALLLLKTHWHMKKTPTTKQAYKEYFGDLKITDWATKTNLIKKRYSDIIGDFILGCPTYFFANDYLIGSPNSSVYFYTLTHKARVPLLPICVHKWMGVCHAEDVPLMFGYPKLYPALYSKDDQQLSSLMVYYWTNFAKTGNPMSGKPPTDLKIKGIENWPQMQWSRYLPEHQDKVMNLNPKSIEYMTLPMKKRCDTFWKPYFNPN